MAPDGPARAARSGIPYAIRQAEPRDIPVITDLWHAMREEAHLEDDQLLPGWRASMAAFLRDQIATRDAVVWVAEVDGVIVGTTLVLLKRDFPFFLLTPGFYAFIGCVYTAPAARRQGIASALVGRAIEWARDRGARSVRLLPSEVARPMYERAGFGRVDDLSLDLQ